MYIQRHFLFFTSLISLRSYWILAFLTPFLHVQAMSSISSSQYFFVSELSQEFLGYLCWPSVMPALLFAHQNGLFYFQNAISEGKPALLGHLGRPALSLMRAHQDVPWKKYLVLNVQSSVCLVYISQDVKCTIPCLQKPGPSRFFLLTSPAELLP